MYEKLSDWLDEILPECTSEDVAAFGFNLYEEGGGEWAMELVGTSRFDMEDEDWCCDEVTDFGTRDVPFEWEQKASWEEILEEVSLHLQKYLACGEYADILKKKSGVGVGFVDGDIKIIYAK